MVQYMRDHEGEVIIQEDILAGCPMARKTAWKALMVLLEQGDVETSTTRGPTGRARTLYRMEDWALMTEEQRTEAIGLLRSIDSELKRANGPRVITITGPEGQTTIRIEGAQDVGPAIDP